MKLLVLAQTPPPLHGQSTMVRALVDGLPAHGVALHHVNLPLSRDAADIGRWRVGKLFVLLDACLHAVIARFRHRCDTLYYVPAPAKRGALYRDWIVMLLCRPFFPRLALHWHASGLGEWLAHRATPPERWLSQLLLGRANLSIVLGAALREDANFLRPRRTVVIRNGIPDPCPGFVRADRREARERTALFLGLVIPEKGVRDALAAVDLANRGSLDTRWRLVVAGPMPDEQLAAMLRTEEKRDGHPVVVAGFVEGDAKRRLMVEADVLLFPTVYPAETQGLVVAEALAYDLPVVVTQWRAVAENLPPEFSHCVPVRAPGELAETLLRLASYPAPAGRAREWFLAHYTIDRHLSAVARELQGLAGSA